MSEAASATSSADHGDCIDDQIDGHETARARRRREQPVIGLNLTSMIDVVFLLLVYFMVATEFKLGEELYQLDLPDRRAAQAERDPFELDDEPLRVRVATTGPRPAEYQVRLDGPYPAMRTFDELDDFFEQRRLGNGAAGGIFAIDHPIIIEPTGTTTWQHALSAFNAAARHGFTNVTLGAAQ